MSKKSKTTEKRCKPKPANADIPRRLLGGAKVADDSEDLTPRCEGWDSYAAIMRELYGNDPAE